MALNLTIVNDSSLTSATNQTMVDPGAIVLFSVGTVCVLGNLLAITNIIFNPRYRKTTLAILCHHCFLDFIKALYCFPYGYSLLTSHEIPYCHLVGSSYVFVMTTSAYNLLALVVNEEYSLNRSNSSPYAGDNCQITRDNSRTETFVKTSSNDISYQKRHINNSHGERHCVVFGIFIIWFMSLLLNLGVAIIPSNTTYIQEIGNCIFLYGVPDGFVLHVLWVTLVTMAIVLATASFFHIYRRISVLAKEAKWSYIHESLSNDIQDCLATDSEENNHRNHQINRSDLQFHMRRILIFISMVTCFALFWYPLFFLTIFDPQFQEPSLLYKILSIVAWCQPVTTPLFSALVLRDVKIRDSLVKDVSSNTIPLLQTRRQVLTNEDLSEEDILVSELGTYNVSDLNIIVNMDTSPSESRIQQLPTRIVENNCMNHMNETSPSRFQTRV